jgi:hypothetical protein
VVWTGKELIVWGGTDCQKCFKDGSRYDPVADTWVTNIYAAAPELRSDGVAVWDGNEMIIRGGHIWNSRQDSGEAGRAAGELLRQPLEFLGKLETAGLRFRPWLKRDGCGRRLRARSRGGGRRIGRA